MKHSRQTRWMAAALLALLVVGCAAGAGQAEPTTEAVVDTGPAVVSATGEVVPAQEATLSFATTGTIVELLVEVGDEVETGAVIARLDTGVLEAEVGQAEAGLAVAEAELERAKAGPRAAEIDEAKDNVAAASAEVARAAAERDDMQAGVPASEIASAKADVQQAFVEMIQTRTDHDFIADVLENIDDYSLRKRMLYTDELVDDARDVYDIAQQNLESAQAYLDDLLDGPNPDDVRVSEAELWAASAEYEAEQARLELLLTGPQPEDIAVAEAGIEQARVVLEQAELALEQATLVAPFGGTVGEVYVRQAQHVNAGEPVVLLAELGGLRVETTDLNEIDVAGIEVGDEAVVTFDALPGVEVDGTVTHIASKAAEGAGVNFTVVIEADNLPQAVRWGMTAFVDIPLK